MLAMCCLARVKIAAICCWSKQRFSIGTTFIPHAAIILAAFSKSSDFHLEIFDSEHSQCSATRTCPTLCRPVKIVEAIFLDLSGYESETCGMATIHTIKKRAAPEISRAAPKAVASPPLATTPPRNKGEEFAADTHISTHLGTALLQVFEERAKRVIP